MKKIIMICTMMCLSFTSFGRRSDFGGTHNGHKTFDPALLLALGILVVLMAISIIVIALLVSYFKNKKIKKQEKIMQDEEENWTTVDGKSLQKKLLDLLNNNESISMYEIDELKDLSIINLDTVNEKYKIKNDKTQFRLWGLIEFLNDRYTIENSELNGLSDKDVLEKYSINISDDEVVYKVFEDCSWFELKRNASGISHGIGLRIPLGGGLSYRAGLMNRINSEEYKEVSTGTIYLTNKRIIFNGLQNKVVNINSLIDIQLFSDSIILGKQTGKKPLIKFDLDDAAIFSRTISKIF